MAWANDFAPNTVKGIGALELLGAIGLILPWLASILPWLTPLAAAGLVVTMIGAFVTHLRCNGINAQTAEALVTFSLNLRCAQPTFDSWHGEAKLACQEKLGAIVPLAYPAAQQGFAFAAHTVYSVRVDIGGVDKRAASRHVLIQKLDISASVRPPNSIAPRQSALTATPVVPN